jgi:hypothetical protein
MAERQQRRYTKRQKLATTMAVEMTSLTETAETTGIPKSTIQYWMEDPELGAIRTKTREDLADEIGVVAHLAWAHVAASLRDGRMEPRDAIFAAEKATSLQILMAGGATSRTELRDISGSLSDLDIADTIRAAEDYARAGDSGTAETPAPEAAG